MEVRQRVRVDETQNASTVHDTAAWRRVQSPGMLPTVPGGPWSGAESCEYNRTLVRLDCQLLPILLL